MEINIKLCPEKICRTCLSESTQMRSLSAKIEGENRTVLEVLNFVANINVSVENRLPDQLCNECETILYKADAFKRRCMESEMILSQTLEIFNHGHSSNDILENSVVKDEKNLDIVDIKLDSSNHSSNNTVKASNSSISDIYDNLPGVEGKLNFFADVTVSKHTTIKDDVNKHVGPEIIPIEVKNEMDNDVSFDYDDSQSYESIVEELKEEKITKEPKNLKCSCGIVCENKNEYRLHIFTTNCTGFKPKRQRKKDKCTNNLSVKKIVCTVCKEAFNTLKACKIHQRKHKDSDAPDSGNFECTMCMRKFTRKSAFTNHMKNHNLKDAVKFTCDTCKRTFNYKAHLDNHILSVHTREKGFSCEICMNSFTTEASLEIHKESHKIEKKHVCGVCKKAFYMLSTLNDHLRVHTGEKPYLCSICGKGFSQKTNLAQHMRRHQGLKPFKCEECDRRFVSKGELTAHSRSHSGAHPFVCEDCGGGFTTSSSLVKHRRTHTGERPYACDLCPMKFAASGTLKNHRRTHTGEKPFQCSYCEKAFVQRHDLISHIRGHTGERPYSCGCGQAFRKASALKAHVRLHEKEPQRELSVLQPPTMLLATLPSGHPPIAPV